MNYIIFQKHLTSSTTLAFFTIPKSNLVLKIKKKKFQSWRNSSQSTSLVLFLQNNTIVLHMK